jgi:hypothetical protein
MAMSAVLVATGTMLSRGLGRSYGDSALPPPSVGTVATTTGTPEDPSLHLYIASPVPLSSLEYVSVLPQ